MYLELCHPQAIGDGGYGKVYHALMAGDKSRPRKLISLKKARTASLVTNPVLRHEACVLLRLRDHSSIPRVYAWGKSQWFEYLAMELLGPCIHPNTTKGERLTMRNLIVLVCQMFNLLEYMHSQGLVHGDIKPDNFLFGLPPKEGRIHLIDFGLTKPWRDPFTLHTFPPRVNPSLRGTAPFASIPVHLHSSPSRRDDVESLSYTIAWLLRGPLPWYDKDDSDIFLVKQQWSGPDICSGYAPVFGEFIEYARAMTFDESPDYAYWTKQFRAVVLDELPEHPDYDHSDRTEPFVGCAISGTPLQNDNSRPIISFSPDSEWSDYSDDDFFPPQSWPGASSVHKDDLIGDEESLVQEVERVVDPPHMAWPYTEWPEVMII